MVAYACFRTQDTRQFLFDTSVSLLITGGHLLSKVTIMKDVGLATAAIYSAFFLLTSEKISWLATRLLRFDSKEKGCGVCCKGLAAYTITFIGTIAASSGLATVVGHILPFTSGLGLSAGMLIWNLVPMFVYTTYKSVTEPSSVSHCGDSSDFVYGGM